MSSEVHRDEKDADIIAGAREIGDRAAIAAGALAHSSTQKKNACLGAVARLIGERAAAILKVNAVEAAAAKERGVSSAFIDRLTLDEARLEGIAEAVRQIAMQDDPVGVSIRKWRRPNGLEIERVRTPIGVIAIIYESRPNVTVDAGAISLKAGNAVILRGGSECFETNRALFACLEDGTREAGLPDNAVQFITTTNRTAVGALLSGLGGTIDLVIPRGGKSLVARVESEARAPVLSHLDGICHIYVDGDADIEKAVAITLNAKMRRTGVCGAAETLLIDKARLGDFLPPIARALRDLGCELRGDDRVCAVDRAIAKASEQDWRTEYLDAILSIAAVDGVDAAIAHIAKYSSGHTESIVTENNQAAEKFLSEVDSAIVMHNASTQFADGGEFGLGAEIGISTGKLHARGPVGVEELTTYKNIVRGAGQVRP